MDEAQFKRILQRERNARKEAEYLLEKKASKLYNVNQNLEKLVASRTQKLSDALNEAKEAIKVKNNFLSNMSHEIRTPLNAILGFIDIMKTEDYHQEKFTRYLEITHASGTHLLHIINNILDYSKLKENKFTIFEEICDIRQAFENTYALFQEEAIKKEINYSIQIGKDFPASVMADKTRITQILSNLLSNAIKFTPSKGSVELDIHYNHTSQILTVMVKDTGLGINKKSQDKIFQSFEQEDTSLTRKEGGTGLGLAITSQLIKLMDGEIIFTSTQGKGSLFGFHIPIQRANSTANQVANKKAPLDTVFKGKILIAEDNEMNIILIEAFMEKLKITYDIVYDGEAAVVASSKNLYSLILMDNQMPKLSGIDASKKIRQFNTTIPIIALSANALKEDKILFQEAGMNDLIAKPIEYEKLKTILEKYLT